MVVSLNHLGRLDIYSLTTCRLVVYDTMYLALKRRQYRYHQATIAHRGRYILVDITFILCLAQNGIQRARQPCHCSRQIATYGKQLGRSVVAYTTCLVEYKIYLLGQLRIYCHVACQSRQIGVKRSLVVGGLEERYQSTYCFERATKIVHLGNIHKRTLYTNTLEHRAHIKKEVGRKILIATFYTQHLLGAM